MPGSVRTNVMRIRYNTKTSYFLQYFANTFYVHEDQTIFIKKNINFLFSNVLSKYEMLNSNAYSNTASPNNNVHVNVYTFIYFFFVLYFYL